MKVGEAVKLAMEVLELSEKDAREFIAILLLAKALLGDDIDGLISFMDSLGYDFDAVYEFLAELGWL